MNAILSIMVCIAMLVSPTGVIPAQPETAATWTISDLTISVGEESVTLTPEARFTAAVGAEEAQLHFELGNGESTLMPMSGAINADGVRFTLGTGTKTYTLDDATLMELAGMDIPLLRRRITTDRAIDHYNACGQDDKARLLYRI